MNGRVVGYDPDHLLPDGLWRPRNWDAAPVPPRKGRPGWLWLIVGVVALYNPTVNLLLPDASHVPANLAVAGLLVWMAWKAGATLDNLGLRADMAGRGLLVGGIVAGVVAAGVVVTTAVPQTREFFADDRFIGVGTAEMMYEVLIRIPLGTVAAEELLFRGVVVGLLLRRWPLWVAATAAAVLFGLWHVIPVFDSIDTNPAGDLVSGPWAVFGSVAGTVLFTGFVGYGFTWLRFRGNSLVAPILAHVATNSFGYIAGWMVVTRAWV